MLGTGGTVWQQVFQLCGSHVACIGPVCLPHFLPAVGTICSELSVNFSSVERSDKRYKLFIETNFVCLKICVQALYMAVVVRPVDPEVEERLAQETEVRRTEDDVGDKVHPPSGYGLLQAKEEAWKLKKLRVLMRVSTNQGFLKN